MLDVSFFANPRFTAASSAVTLVFFALFGFSFLQTQYFQFVLGYSAAETGVRLLPLALTIMVVAPLSSRIVERVGTKVVVATGLSVVSLSLVLQLQLTADSDNLAVMWRMMLLALGMGLTMAPATESIMGSLPLAKAGVGSAMNDTTRQVGGALGVAVIGSVLSSVYGSKITDTFAGKMPPEALSIAESGVGGALAVAERAGSAGAQVAAVARDAFVDAMHGGALVAAAASIIGVIVVALYLPARARDEDAELQAEEYRSELADAVAHGDDVSAASSS